jgi:hypothetical protein
MRAVRGRRVLAAFACVLLGLVAGEPRASRAQSAPTDPCSQCQPGWLCILGNDTDNQNPPRPLWHGCCPPGGTVCYGPSGPGACCSSGVCDETTGTCRDSCRAGTRLCISEFGSARSQPAPTPLNNHCVACAWPKVWEPITCQCLTPCTPGHARCGEGCCAVGAECATPKGLRYEGPNYPGFETPMVCCSRTPFGNDPLRRQLGGACGFGCAQDMGGQPPFGLQCCKRGPAFDPKTGLRTGAVAASPAALGTFCCEGEAHETTRGACCADGTYCPASYGFVCHNGKCVSPLGMRLRNLPRLLRH